MSRKPRPKTRIRRSKGLAPGQRYDEWSEKKRREQRDPELYADNPEELLETDLAGRHYPALQHRKGQHEGLAGFPQADPDPGDPQFQPAGRATQKHDPPPDDAVPEPPEGEREPAQAKTAASTVKKRRD